MTHMEEESEEERELRLQATLASLMTPTEEDEQQMRARWGPQAEQLLSLGRVSRAVPQLERLINGLPVVGSSPVTDAVAAAGRTWADFGLREADAAMLDEIVTQAAARARGEHVD
ncbi:hypothetical protein [Streptomyces sp. NPDC048386]|uniref:hypothetical protein n=1 Tax=Streptomyces sp. NPDC048386 TaxID=3365541 RepID=UPI0037246EB5